jgi:hypothetical protein
MGVTVGPDPNLRVVQDETVKIADIGTVCDARFSVFFVNGLVRRCVVRENPDFLVFKKF